MKEALHTNLIGAVIAMTCLPGLAIAQTPLPMSIEAALGRCATTEGDCRSTLLACKASGRLACFPSALKCPAWDTTGPAISEVLDRALSDAPDPAAPRLMTLRSCLAFARLGGAGPIRYRLKHAQAALEGQDRKDWPANTYFHSARLAARLLPRASAADVVFLLQHMSRALRAGCRADAAADGEPSAVCLGLVRELGIEVPVLVPGVPAILPSVFERDLLAASGAGRARADEPESGMTPTPAQALRSEVVLAGSWRPMVARKRIDERLSRLTREPPIDPPARCAVAAELITVAEALGRVEPHPWLAALTALGHTLRAGAETLTEDDRAAGVPACPTSAGFAAALWSPLERAVERLSGPSNAAVSTPGRAEFFTSVEQAAIKHLDSELLANAGRPGAHWKAGQALARRMLDWPTPAPYGGLMIYSRRLVEQGRMTAAIVALKQAIARAAEVGVRCAFVDPSDPRTVEFHAFLKGVRHLVVGSDDRLPRRWQWLDACLHESEPGVDPVPPRKPVAGSSRKQVRRGPRRPVAPEDCTLARAQALDSVQAGRVRWTLLGGPRCGETRSVVSIDESRRRCTHAGGRLPTPSDADALRRVGASGWFWISTPRGIACEGNDGSLDMQLKCTVYCTKGVER